jgi:hypothetical protein
VDGKNVVIMQWLIVTGVIIERKCFNNIEAASQFALDKMRAYNAG